jgi:DNA-binding CsgD family transcriptional regulator
MPQAEGETVVEGIVARQKELAALDDFLERIPEGPQGLFLEGDAGIGKTRIWREGLVRARARGLRVLASRPGGAEVQLAFAGIADLLRDVLEETLAELPPPQRRALAIALLLEDSRGIAPDDRAVAAAFLAALRTVAAAGPVLVAVDDVQWLDAASMLTLEFALRRLEEEPVGVLGTVRVSPEEPEPVELIRALPHERLSRIPLGPLTVAAVYELIGSRLGSRPSRATLLRLHETSEGNPFYALELARALLDAGREPEPGDPLPVPAGLRELVRRRLRRLPPGALEALLVASALNPPTLTLVRDAAGDAAAEGVELAVGAGVVELEGDGIRFTHPLLASIHYASTPPRRRQALHGRLATVVSDPEERARHLALSNEGPDEEVATALEAAANRAKGRGALVAAAELMNEALTRTPSSSAPTLRRRRLAAAEAHYAAGDRDRALRPLEAELSQTAAGPERAEVLWSMGKIKFEGEDTRVGGEFFRRALAETGDDDLLRARILQSLAFPAAKQEGFRAAREYVRQAAELADRLGDKPTLARALAELGHIEFMCDEGVKAELFERAIALEDELGGLELDYGPSIRYARTLYDAGSYDRARPLLERLCERGRASGDAAVNMPLFVLACIELEVGNWERAEELAKEAHDIAVQTGREAAEPRGLYTLARIEAARGEFGSARTRAEQALVMTDGRGWNSGGPRGSLGFLELTLENFEAAYEVLMPAIETYRKLGVPIVGQILDGAEALAGMGRTAEGQALLDRTKEASAMMRLPWPTAAVARARGLLAAAEGDLERAQTALEDAVSTGERLGWPLELGRSLLVLGTVQRRAQKKQAARRTLERALEVFDGLGAKPWAERARRELGRIGGRTAPRDGLSATEAEIVNLVVAGRSNKEVAQALHLSPKTVEWNLSKVYRKLGVHSRTELAASRTARR